jgi:hypothetical protein
MLLLWLNTVIAASACTVWALWAGRWVKREAPLFAVLYAIGAVGAAGMALGFALVLVGGVPSVSAYTARLWASVALGAPALARLLELVLEMRRERAAHELMGDAEDRADRFDAEQARR